MCIIRLVYLGGGTLDISILWLANGMFVVQAMAGNNRLGFGLFLTFALLRILSLMDQNRNVKNKKMLIP